MNICRTCDQCQICGRMYLKTNGNVCKWLNPDSSKYGFDCENISCPTCRFCCYDHCSNTSLLRAIDIRVKDYISNLTEITKRIKKT
jgi:hypothetical protein